MYYRFDSATTLCTGHVPFQASIRFTCLPESINLESADSLLEAAEDQLQEALSEGHYDVEDLELQDTDGNEVFFKGNLVVTGRKTAVLEHYSGLRHEIDWDDSFSLITFPKGSIDKMRALGMEPHIVEEASYVQEVY